MLTCFILGSMTFSGIFNSIKVSTAIYIRQGSWNRKKKKTNSDFLKCQCQFEILLRLGQKFFAMDTEKHESLQPLTMFLHVCVWTAEISSGGFIPWLSYNMKQDGDCWKVVFKNWLISTGDTQGGGCHLFKAWEKPNKEESQTPLLHFNSTSSFLVSMST